MATHVADSSASVHALLETLGLTERDWAS
jgi:hypothetical protein